jgi:hypothetical protein
MVAVGGEGGGMMPRRSRPEGALVGSAFKGFRFPPEVIVLAVRWYLRFGLSYRDVEELLIERGVEVNHVTVYRWVQRFTPLLVDAAPTTRSKPRHSGISRDRDPGPARGTIAR